MNASKKELYAPKGEKVFTYIGTGLWLAELYGESVMLERVAYNTWKCISEDTDEVLGEGETRNEAMREAFYNIMEDKGYDAKEADRLDWILTEQLYRSYNGHKPRKKGPTKPRKAVAVKGYKNVSRIVKENPVNDADEVLESFQQAFKKYKTAYNKVLGGYFYYTRDNETGEMSGGLVGPFKDEKAMLKDMVKRELKVI